MSGTEALDILETWVGLQQQQCLDEMRENPCSTAWAGPGAVERLLPGWAGECLGAASHACFVAVEGCDVEHVAVCAHTDRLHLPVAGQRC